MLPYTVDEFRDIFALYNSVIWPLQLVAIVFGAFVAWFVWTEKPRWAFAGLSLFWLFDGVVFHWLYFAQIDHFALVYGLLYVVEGFILLSVQTVGRSNRLSSGIGWALVVFGFVAYPAWGFLIGDRFPETPLFGVTPCPTTIFTIGILLIYPKKSALIIPILWSLVGGTGAAILGLQQDYVLFATFLIASVALVFWALDTRPEKGSLRHK